MEQNPIEQTPQTERMLDSSLISQVEVITESGITPRTKEDLARLVEPPLLEACEELYDKNIKTVMSSANSKDVETGEAYIDIEYESLSEENKGIARELGESFMMHGSVPTECIKLVFSVNVSTTVGDIRRVAHEVVSKFKYQEKIEIDYSKKFEHQKIEEDIRGLPTYKEILVEWQDELSSLENGSVVDKEREDYLRESIPKLVEEIKRREELKDKQK